MTQEQFEWLMSGQTVMPRIRKAKPKNMLQKVAEIVRNS